MAQNTTINNVEDLHIIYSDQLTDATTDSFPAHKLFEKVADKDPGWDGNGFSFHDPILMHGAANSTYIPETGGYVETDTPVIRELNIKMKYCNTSIGGTKQIIELSKGKKAAYKQFVDLQIMAKARDYRRKAERVLFGNGSGRLCQVGVAAAIGATTVSLINPNMQITANNGAKFLTQGRKIAFVDPTDTTLISVHTVVSVVAPGSSITITPALPAALLVNSIVYEAPYTAVSTIANLPKNNEAMGLGGMIADATGLATYFGVSRTLFPQISSPIIPGIGALNQGTTQRIMSLLQATSTDEINPKTTTLLCNHATRDAILALGQALQRFPTVQMIRNPDTGTDAMSNMEPTTNGGFKILASHYANEGELYVFQHKGAKKAVRMDGWDTTTGSMWRQGVNVDGRPSFDQVAFHHVWHEYWHTNPRSCGRATGITTTFTYVPIF
jgi:hypothetical protein